MVEELSPASQNVLMHARREADHLHHRYLGSEHVLLGILAEGTSPAARLLERLGVDGARVREQLEKIVQPGPPISFGVAEPPLTPRAESLLARARHEASGADVTPEQLLLSLLQEHESVAVQVLRNLNLSADELERGLGRD